MHKYTKIYKIAMPFLESACSDTSINVKYSLRLKKKTWKHELPGSDIIFYESCIH